CFFIFFFQAEDGIRDFHVTGVQTCALPIFTTTHDHYSTEMSLQHRADRTGATVKRISLYDEPAKAGTDEIISRMLAGINDHTRVLAVTWVHSSTGVKLPIAEMAQALEQLNA